MPIVPWGAGVGEFYGPLNEVSLLYRHQIWEFSGVTCSDTLSFQAQCFFTRVFLLSWVGVRKMVQAFTPSIETS